MPLALAEATEMATISEMATIRAARLWIADDEREAGV
jgi:hypothetical protein